jgi:hypothetical protein
VGRYRGQAVDDTYDAARVVYLFWGENGERCYMRHRFRLGQELEPAKPQIGDIVAVYRGPDYVTQAGNSGHAYGVEVEQSDEPLTDKPAAVGPSDEARGVLRRPPHREADLTGPLDRSHAAMLSQRP